MSDAAAAEGRRRFSDNQSSADESPARLRESHLNFGARNVKAFLPETFDFASVERPRPRDGEFAVIGGLTLELQPIAGLHHLVPEVRVRDDRRAVCAGAETLRN